MLIIHGDNPVLSRNKLTEKIKNFKGEVVRFEGSKVDLTGLKQAIESHSLFGTDRLIIIENLFSRRPSKDKEIILKYFRENFPPNLIVWEGKKVDGRTLASFSKAQINKFNLSPIVFKFLDSLAPNAKKMSLVLFHQCLKTDPPEIIFYLLIRQLTHLIIARDLGEKGLTDLAPWQKQKIVRQAQRFSLEKLTYLYQEFLRIDYQQKTGKTLLPLISQLDLWLASL